MNKDIKEKIYRCFSDNSMEIDDEEGVELFDIGSTVDRIIQLFNQEITKAVVEAETKYYDMTETVIKGQRFLVDKDGNKLPFGYPYPDTKEKYILEELSNNRKSEGI